MAELTSIGSCMVSLSAEIIKIVQFTRNQAADFEGLHQELNRLEQTLSTLTNVLPAASEKICGDEEHHLMETLRMAKRSLGELKPILEEIKWAKQRKPRWFSFQKSNLACMRLDVMERKFACYSRALYVQPVKLYCEPNSELTVL
jgi:hypothetical protein